MTNNSIGGFLAELRKEKGITQKELAEFLNVSDKTVSHWECDKYSPDISIIPILAEYFGVTCDDILRGERTAPLYNENNFSFEPLNKPTEFEKYAKIRLQNAYNKLKTSMVINAFVSTFTVAIPWTIVWFLDYQDIIGDALVMLPYIVFFAACLFMLITYLAYQKFKTALSFIDSDKAELSRCKRKSALVIAIPFILCLMALILFVFAIMPSENADVDITETVTGPPTTSQPTSYSDDSTTPSSPVQSLVPSSVEPTGDFNDRPDSSVPVSDKVNIFTD